MRQIPIIFSFLILLISCSKKPFKIKYSTKNSDVLYVGVEHKIKIGNVKEKLDTIYTDKGSITHIDSNLYILFPDTTWGILNLTVVKNKKSSHTKFRVKNITGINVFAATDTLHYLRNINAINFRKFKYLGCRVENFDHYLIMNVESYELTHIGKTTTRTVKIKNTSSRPNHAKRLTRVARSGDIYIFKKIIISVAPESDRPDRKYIKKMNDLVYYIN
jgi:hypothetical protein